MARSLRHALWRIRELQAGDGLIRHPVRVFRDNLAVMQERNTVAEALPAPMRRPHRHAAAIRMRRLVEINAKACACRSWYRTRCFAPWFIDQQIAVAMAAAKERGEW